MSTFLIALVAAAGGAAVGALVVAALMFEALRAARIEARNLGRLHLAVSARLHERDQLIARKERRGDALVARMAILQRDIEAMREAGTAVAMAAQLDALWKRADWHDSQPAPLDE